MEYLFEKALANTDNIDKDFVLAKLEKNYLNDVSHDIQKNATISINRNAEVLLKILKKDDKPLISGCKAATDAGLTFPQHLNQSWPDAPRKYHRRRIVFKESFEKGEDHLFGALNMGGPGTAAKNAAYGCYCIVFKKESINSLEDIAYCKHDSLDEDEYWTCPKKECDEKGCLNKCRDENCVINFKKLLGDYAPHSHRGKMAAIKHKDELEPDMSHSDIAKIIIKRVAGNTEKYIEACFVAKLKKTDILEVRLHEELAPKILKEAVLSKLNKQFQNRGSIMIPHSKIIKKLKEIGKEPSYE